MQNTGAAQTMQDGNQPLITGLILAGGQGTRLGGVDKGLQVWRGQPLVQWILARLSQQVGSLRLNCNRHQARYAALGHPVIADRTGGFSGPLAGLQAGLQVCTTPYLLTVPCDAPFLPLDLARRLFAVLDRARQADDPAPLAAIATVAGQPGNDGPDWQPVFALYHRDALPGLDSFLQQGLHQVRRWQKTLPHCLVDFSDQPEAFANLNTAEEWAASEAAI